MKKIILISKKLFKNVFRISYYGKKWPVGTPATAVRRGWCLHQPQYGERKFHFLTASNSKKHFITNNLVKIAAVIITTCFTNAPVLAQVKQDSMSQHGNAIASPMLTRIHQEVDFKASPRRVYEALLDAKQFSGFSAMSARIDSAVGGVFSLFNNHIIGRNLELIPGQRIVQAWRVVDWSPGVYSIAKFELTSQGSGTHLVFDHTGFPENLGEHLAEGWQTHYWDLLAKYLH